MKRKQKRITAGWKMGSDARGVCKSVWSRDSQQHIMTTVVLFLFRLWKKDQQGGV